MKLFFACTAVAVISFGVGSYVRAAQVVEPVISTNEGGCWNKCKDCEPKCKQDNACKDKCYATNDACCAGVGGKGVYKMCGCTDK
jgi:hypothetical protein